MEIKKIKIIFDQQDSVYYPGQTVVGTVSFSLNKLTTFQIEVKLKGKAKVEWKEQNYDSNGNPSYTSIREDKEKFFSEEIKLNGGKELELPVGEHKCPFSVRLPHIAPSTYTGENGEIAYYAKAKLHIPQDTDTQNCVKEFFIVQNVLDLNNFPLLKNVHKEEKTKKFCYLCCAGGSLTLAVCVPKTGFAKFETIPVTIEVDNTSLIRVQHVKVYIKRNINWLVNDVHHLQHTKKTVEKLDTLILGAVEPRKSQTWNENVRIPNVDFPIIDGVSIIKIAHLLDIKAEMKGMHTDLYIHIPIVIGDTPFTENCTLVL